MREHGVLQFLHVFNAVKSREKDCLRWGDEIEYHLMRFDDGAKDVRITLTAPEVLERLKKLDDDPATKPVIPLAWHPEYGSWMVEGVYMFYVMRGSIEGITAILVRSNAGSAVWRHQRCFPSRGGEHGPKVWCFVGLSD